MLDDNLIDDIKSTQRLSQDWRNGVNNFISGVLEVTLNFIDERSRVSVGGYEITKKHPWFLNKKRYGDEICIKTSKKVLISWLNFEPSIYKWEHKYKVTEFDYNDLENVKFYLSQLRSLLDIDLLEVQLDQLNDIKDIEKLNSE